MDTNNDLEVAIELGQLWLTFKYFCDLLIEKGVITKEEFRQVVTAAKNDMGKILLEENKLWINRE